MSMSQEPHLLSVQELKTYFYTFEGVAKAVDDVSFTLDKGEVIGLVGESGCGKSVTAQSVMRLIPDPPGKIAHGRISFDSTDILGLTLEAMRSIRGKRISMIFQEPMTSLNPVFTIGDQIAEMFILHEKLSSRQAWEQAIAMLQKVQVPAPEKRVHEYPHQLSGGMRQRAMIAMALACNPEILIADEPTTALDVTVQAQILDLMLQLKEDYHSAIMMITHDLGVIAEMAQRVVVMYAGKVVEQAETLTLFDHPLHPYTQGLLQSIPKLGGRAGGGSRELLEIKGMVPGLLQLPKGCAFHPRCTRAFERCHREVPQLREMEKGHLVRCWLY
jgi:peptide/nickel transport system ATP-binding protein/oligopeptide transport system ATP-binding protein